METQGINFSYKKLVSKFRFHGDIMGKPNLLWRTALWFLFFAAIIIAVSGYLMYQWAISADETHMPTKTERPTLSLTELESVVGLYQKKQINFSAPNQPFEPPSRPASAVRHGQRFEVQRARTLFHQGMPLVKLVPGDVQADIELSFVEFSNRHVGEIEA